MQVHRRTEREEEAEEGRGAQAHHETGGRIRVPREAGQERGRRAERRHQPPEAEHDRARCAPAGLEAERQEGIGRQQHGQGQQRQALPAGDPWRGPAAPEPGGEGHERQPEDGERRVAPQFLGLGIEAPGLEASERHQVGERLDRVPDHLLQRAHDGPGRLLLQVGQQQGRQREEPRQRRQNGRDPEAAAAEEVGLPGEAGRREEGEGEEDEDRLVELGHGQQPPHQRQSDAVADAAVGEEAPQQQVDQRDRKRHLHLELVGVAQAVGQDAEEQAAGEGRRAADAERQQEPPHAGRREGPEGDQDDVVDPLGRGAREARQQGGRQGGRPGERLVVERAGIGVEERRLAVAEAEIPGEDLARHDLQFPGVERRIPVVEEEAVEVAAPGPGQGQDAGRRRQQAEERGDGRGDARAEPSPGLDLG